MPQVNNGPSPERKRWFAPLIEFFSDFKRVFSPNTSGKEGPETTTAELKELTPPRPAPPPYRSTPPCSSGCPACTACGGGGCPACGG